MTQYTPKYNLPVEELGDEADMPEYSSDLAEKVEAALDDKATTKDLDKVSLASDTKRTFSSGWVVCENKAIRGGKPVNLAVQSGRQYIGDLQGTGNDITLVWTNVGVVVGVDNTFVGVIQMAPPSMGDNKDNLRKAEVGRSYPEAPDYAGFLNAVDVYDYQYKADAEGNGVYAGTDHVGFVVDFVADVLADHNMPEGMIERSEDGKPIGFVERDLIAVLWQNLKELSARVATLEGGAP